MPNKNSCANMSQRWCWTFVWHWLLCFGRHHSHHIRKRSVQLVFNARYTVDNISVRLFCFHFISNIIWLDRCRFVLLANMPMTGALCRNFYFICWLEIVAIFWLLWHQIVCLITHVYGYDVQTIFVHFWPFMSFCENDESCVCVLYSLKGWMRRNERKNTARITEIKQEQAKMKE